MSDDDDERHVEAFRQLLARARAFRDRLAGSNDLAGAVEGALVLVGEQRDLLLASGLSDFGMLVLEAARPGPALWPRMDRGGGGRRADAGGRISPLGSDWTGAHARRRVRADRR